MSINAIGSVSLYEYYYKLNKDQEKKKQSPLEDEMRKYGLVPTENEATNIALLKNAKEVARSEQETEKPISYSDRPWADLMYQLNLEFNPNPKDDIEDIKKELGQLMQGFDDDELEKEISDLESYVENLYIGFEKTDLSKSSNSVNLINMQLNNLATMNQINFQ